MNARRAFFVGAGVTLFIVAGCMVTAYLTSNSWDAAIFWLLVALGVADILERKK